MGATLAACHEDALIEEIPVSDWRTHADQLKDLVDRYEGLIPLNLVPDFTGMHRSRMYQLADKGVFEIVNFNGVSFISGRSLDRWETEQKPSGGRGKRRPSIWQRVYYSWVVGSALADSLAPDKKTVGK